MAHVKKPKPVNNIVKLLNKPQEDWNQNNRDLLKLNASPQRVQHLTHATTTSKDHDDGANKKGNVLKGLLGVSLKPSSSTASVTSSIVHNTEEDIDKAATLRIGAALGIGTKSVSNGDKYSNDNRMKHNPSDSRNVPNVVTSNSNSSAAAHKVNQSNMNNSKWNETKTGQNQREIFEKERQAILQGRAATGKPITVDVDTHSASTAKTIPTNSSTATKGYHDECDDLMKELMVSSNQNIAKLKSSSSSSRTMKLMEPLSPEQAPSPRDKGGGLLMGQGPGGSLDLPGSMSRLNYTQNTSSFPSNFPRSLTAKEVMQRSHVEDNYNNNFFSPNGLGGGIGGMNKTNDATRSLLENIDLSALLNTISSSHSSTGGGSLSAGSVGNTGGGLYGSSGSGHISTSSSGLSLSSLSTAANPTIGVGVGVGHTSTNNTCMSGLWLNTNPTVLPMDSSIGGLSNHNKPSPIPPSATTATTTATASLWSPMPPHTLNREYSINSQSTMDSMLSIPSASAVAKTNMNGHHMNTQQTSTSVQLHHPTTATGNGSAATMSYDDDDDDDLPLVTDMLKFGDFEGPDYDLPPPPSTNTAYNHTMNTTTSYMNSNDTSAPPPGLFKSNNNNNNNNNNNFNSHSGTLFTSPSITPVGTTTASTASGPSHSKKIDVKSLFSPTVTASTLTTHDSSSPDRDGILGRSAGSTPTSFSKQGYVNSHTKSSFTFNTPVTPAPPTNTNNIHHTIVTPQTITPSSSSAQQMTNVSINSMNSNSNSATGKNNNNSGVKMSAATRLQLQRLKALTGSGTVTVISSPKLTSSSSAVSSDEPPPTLEPRPLNLTQAIDVTPTKSNNNNYSNNSTNTNNTNNNTKNVTTMTAKYISSAIAAKESTTTTTTSTPSAVSTKPATSNLNISYSKSVIKGQATAKEIKITTNSIDATKTQPQTKITNIPNQTNIIDKKNDVITENNITSSDTTSTANTRMRKIDLKKLF